MDICVLLYAIVLEQCCQKKKFLKRPNSESAKKYQICGPIILHRQIKISNWSKNFKNSQIYRQQQKNFKKTKIPEIH